MALERLDGDRTDRVVHVFPPRLVSRGSTAPVPRGRRRGATA